MSSKGRLIAWQALAVAFAIAALGGCGRKTVPDSSALSLAGAQVGCLSRAAGTIRRYLDGQAGESETASVWDCGTQAMRLFETRVEGARAGVYSPQELRNFLEYYFLDAGSHISDGMLAEAMELKRALVGGTAAQLTDRDLETGVALLGVIREQSLLLRPYMPLTPEAFENASDARIDEAAGALLRAAQALGTALQDAGKANGQDSFYLLSHLKALVTELQAFMGSDAPPVLGMVLDHFKLLEAAKATLVAPPSEQIALPEWSTVLTAGAQAYGLFLKFTALEHQYDSWTLGQGRERFTALAHESLDLIDAALARHPGGQASFEELNRLIESMFPQGAIEVLGADVPVAHAEALLKGVVVQRLMSGANLKSRVAQGLTRQAWRAFRRRFEHWSEGQRYLEALFGQSGKFQIDSSIGFSRTQLLSGAHEAQHQLEASGSAPSADVIRRLNLVISRDRPLFPGQSTGIYLEGHAPPAVFSLHDLSEANWMYELARAVTAGYAGDPARASTSDDETQALTFDEFKSFVDAITPVGVDVKYIDPADQLEAEKRFREAELFTFAGTGSSLMSTRQAAALLPLMISGQRLSDEIHQEILDAGCGLSDRSLDPYGYRLLDAQCYRRVFFGNVEYFWANMPQLASYYRRLSGAARDAFEHAMEDGARKTGYGPAPMNSSDSQGFAMIAQYTEVVFARFDADDSGAIDWNEAQVAFPIFESTLAELSCAQGHCLHGRKDLYAAFTYMLGHGESPSALEFARWRYLPFFRKLSADRGRLMQIFGMLGKPAPAK